MRKVETRRCEGGGLIVRLGKRFLESIRLINLRKVT